MPDQSTNLHNCPVYPLPQEFAFLGADFPLAGAAILLPPKATPQEQFAARLLRDWLADEYLVNLPILDQEPQDETKVIMITTRKSAKKMRVSELGIQTVNQPEGYSLNVSPDVAMAIGRDYRGMLYSVSTIMQLIVRREEGLFLRGCSVQDWPLLPARYVHIYVPGKDDIPFFKRYVRDFLLRYKYNGIIMEVGGGVRLPRHPEIASGWRRTVTEMYAHGDQSWLTGEACPLGPDRRFQDSTHTGLGGGAYIEPEDIKDIVAFARAHGQEVVPEIQSLSHVYHLACTRRDIAERPDVLFPDAYCPSNEESYKLLLEVMDEYIDLMDAKTVHIGHDEWRTAGDCPKCSTQDTADLFARDVIRIYEHLKARGVGVWMWGDHFVTQHNQTGRSLGKGGAVWYLTPSTQGAWEKVVRACPDIVVLNWSWAIPDAQGDIAGSDRELRDKGFRFIYGNFRSQQFEGWPDRAVKYQAMGGEVSSWCRVDEFQLGKLHFVDALYSAGALWSRRASNSDDTARTVALLLPGLRDRMRGTHEPDIRVGQPAQVTIDLAGLFNSPLKTDQFDLSGLSQGPIRELGLDVQFGRGAIVVRRTTQPESAGPLQVNIPVGRPLARLVFWQSSFGQGRRTLHVGDATFFPHDSSEAIGVYDIVFADGIVLAAAIRFDENVAAWDAGTRSILYHALNLTAGAQPDGRPLVVWGNDWTNPRPDVPIVEIRLRGCGEQFEPSQAQPILLGITGVEKVRLSDYRK